MSGSRTFYAQAQTRGTSAIGLGINISTLKSEVEIDGTPSKSETDDVKLSLGYGYFLKDNSKLGFDLSYGKREGGGTTNSYGGLIYYQQYYRLIKTLYAFGGGRVGYDYSETKIPPASPHSNAYALGAYGGISWFLAKRIALEAELLSADIRYSETKSEFLKTTTTNFNLNTTGVISGLDFKIFFLF